MHPAPRVEHTDPTPPIRPHTVPPFPGVSRRVAAPRVPQPGIPRRGGRGRRAAPAAAQSKRVLPREATPPSVNYIYLLWFIILMDPHRYIASLGFGFFHRMGTLSFIPLAAMIAIGAANFLDGRRAWVWFWPFALFIVSGFFSIPTSLNRGDSFDLLKPLIMYYMLAIGTAMTIKTPRQLVPIIVMFCLGQFVWWHLHGGFLRGLVRWHSLLANVDGYGPLMVMGMGLTFFFGLAAQSKKIRWFAFGAAALCVIGVVASFARGAFLGAMAVAGMVLLRSPHRARTLGGFAVGAVILLITANVMFPGGAFWNEMASIVTEGKEGGTGEDRWVLWGLAIQVFTERPVFGVGLGNFGQFAALFFDVGAEEAGHYGSNPGMLVGRSLHSLYFQILSELGIVGTSAFVWMILHFHVRNKALRSAEAIERWNAKTGGSYDLRTIAYGLEAGAVGCLVTAAFYAAYLYVHWVYTLFTINMVLYGVVLGGGAARQAAPPRRRGRGTLGRAAAPG